MKFLNPHFTHPSWQWAPTFRACKTVNFFSIKHAVLLKSMCSIHLLWHWVSDSTFNNPPSYICACMDALIVKLRTTEVIFWPLLAKKSINHSKEDINVIQIPHWHYFLGPMIGEPGCRECIDSTACFCLLLCWNEFIRIGGNYCLFCLHVRATIDVQLQFKQERNVCQPVCLWMICLQLAPFRFCWKLVVIFLCRVCSSSIKSPAPFSLFLVPTLPRGSKDLKSGLFALRPGEYFGLLTESDHARPNLTLYAKCDLPR